MSRHLIARTLDWRLPLLQKRTFLGAVMSAHGIHTNTTTFVGITPLEYEPLWGPAIVEGDKYLFRGEIKPIPSEITDKKNFINNLRMAEAFEWAYSTPEQRKKIFNRKYEHIVTRLPLGRGDIAGIICFLASTIFLVTQGGKKIHSKLQEMKCLERLLSIRII